MSTSSQEARAPVTIPTDTLRAHVQVLAGEIGERNTFRPQALRRAAAYIEQAWRGPGEARMRPGDAVGRGAGGQLAINRRGGGQPGHDILLRPPHECGARRP